MSKFQVEITRPFTVTVEVEAENGQAAIHKVDKADFPIPDFSEWQGLKDWRYVAYDGGTWEEVARAD